MNDPPDYSASTVRLPPAALRLGALEFDPLGHPYYRFPPFLPPADGTPLIPFYQFEAIGIEIHFESDGEELDGNGIPTIELGTKHGPAGDSEKKRKKKRSKNVDNSKKGQPWWEEWGETEDLRRADRFDPYVQLYLGITLIYNNPVTAVILPDATDLFKVHMISSKIATGPRYYNLCTITYVYRLLCL